MPRKNRSDLPDGYFHVITHAVADKPLFEDDADRRLYLGLLQIAAERYGWKVLSFALMTTHVHLAVKARTRDLSKGLWWLHGQYAVRFQRRHPPRRGHVFEARPKTPPIENDAYLLAVLRYIALNPVKAGMVDRPEDHPWSAHGAIIGKAPAIPFIEAAQPWTWFGQGDEGRRRYEAFVLGSDPAEEGRIKREAERPPADRPPLSDLVDAASDDEALRCAHNDWRYSIREIANVTGIDRRTLSRRIR